MYSDSISLSVSPRSVLWSGAAACTHEWPLLSQTQKSFVLTYTKQIILENERTQLNPKLGYLKMAPLVELLHADPNS